jgi:hypothetical protein
MCSELQPGAFETLLIPMLDVYSLSEFWFITDLRMIDMGKAAQVLDAL